MPLNAKGKKILSAMKETYGDKEGEKVFYASINAGKIDGVKKTWQDMLKSISYSAIVLDDPSKKKLLPLVPKGWKPYAHHMTIKLGPLKEDSQYKVGDKVSMNITAVGMDDRAMAVKVDAKREDSRGFPHVTVATSPDGGKPFHSNQIPEENFKPFSGTLTGVVEEVPNR